MTHLGSIHASLYWYDSATNLLLWEVSLLALALLAELEVRARGLVHELRNYVVCGKLGFGRN